MPCQAETGTPSAPGGGGYPVPSEAAAAVLDRKDSVQLEAEACF